LRLLEWRLFVLPQEFNQYKESVLQAVQGTSPAPDAIQHGTAETTVSVAPYDTTKQVALDKDKQAASSNDVCRRSRVVVDSLELLASNLVMKAPSPSVVQPSGSQIGDAALGYTSRSHTKIHSLDQPQAALDRAAAVIIKPTHPPSEPRPQACFRSQARFATPALAQTIAGTVLVDHGAK